MQIGYLKVFCDVASVRSFSQAARANDITQSAVSQIVSQLEKKLEVRLVDRSIRPLQLTPAGQTFYEGCQNLLEQYADLEESIRVARAKIAGKVRVAAIYSVGLGDMGHYVRKMAELHPKVQVHIDYLHPDAVLEHVLEGAADLGLVSFPRTTSKLAAIAWREEEMVVACEPRHPLARNVAVRPQDLAGQKFVHFDKDLVIRRKVDRYLRDLGVKVEVALEFDTVENIKQAVAVGAGLALLPEPTLRREVRARDLVALPMLGSQMRRPVGIIHRRKHSLSGAARLFIDLLLAAPQSSDTTTGPTPSNLADNSPHGRTADLGVHPAGAPASNGHASMGNGTHTGDSPTGDLHGSDSSSPSQEPGPGTMPLGTTPPLSKKKTKRRARRRLAPNS